MRGMFWGGFNSVGGCRGLRIGNWKGLSRDREAKHHGDKDQHHITRWHGIHTGGWRILLVGMKALCCCLLAGDG